MSFPRFKQQVHYFLLTLMLVLLTACTANWSASPNASQAVSKTVTLPPAQPGDAVATLTVAGQPRSYLLHTPPSYKANHRLPLIVAFHGYGSQGKDLANSSGLSELADQQGFLVAYPNGINRRWNVSSLLGGVDDVGFSTALIEHLTQVRAVDPQRIYAVGVSNGGFLVQRLACESSQRIAAFASVVATFPGAQQQSCHPPAPVPLLMINGTADRKVPWQGEGSALTPWHWFLSVPDSVAFWQQQNGCTNKATAESSPNPRVTIQRYSSCRAASEVELVTLKGTGHVYPRGGTGANALIDGTQEIWAFFQRHSRPAQG